jgi:hypothetical protein
MALELVVGYVSDMSEHVDMDSDISSYCSVVFGGFEPTSLSLTSSSGSTPEPDDDAIEYCQCIDSEDVALLQCPDCGSFFELGTYCPRLFE